MVFSPPPPPPQPPIVTVWIHGTRIDECLPSSFAVFTKKVSKLLFAQKLGLHHISTFNQMHYDAIRAAALGTTDPIQFQPEHIYSFGWSGKLNPEARKKASQELFAGLKQLVITMRETYHSDPEIILIAHSHGGNVILHLAEIIDPDGFELTIAKAILLACPVQQKTEHLISAPMFKRIYSLHSHTDLIQIVDLQGLHDKKKISRPLLSLRHFNAHPKLTQAAIRWKNCPVWHPDDCIINEVTMKLLTNSLRTINFLKKNRGLFHIEFQLLPFVRQLPFIINQLDKLFENDANCPSHKDHDIVIEL
jgi:hypothetical protein